MAREQLAPRVTDPPSTLRRSFWMFWILLGAFFLRSALLEIKPVHFDEGINGHFVQTVWRDGFYKYDPTNFHGPLYFYILTLTERLFGIGIFGFRFVTGLINLAAISVVGLHRRFVGSAAIFAALILAVSPGFVFYSRYAIHESLFVLSQVAFSYGYFLYRQEKSTASMWWMALAVVGLVTTKETFVIFLGTWAIAVYGIQIFEKLNPRFANAPDTKVDEPPLQNWIALALISTVLILACFTGFFLYMPGAIDMITALKVWTQTGTAHTGHEKPFLYWIDLMHRYEWPCLIGLFATPAVFFSAGRQLRVLVLVAFGTWLAYSLIPYKTPWLILNLLWPLAMSSGAVIARTIRPFEFWRGLRSGFAVLTLACVAVSATVMWRLNFHDFAKSSEPYVYVQSTEEFKRAVDTIFAHVKRVPSDVAMRVFAMNRDPWPLPYLLETLANVTWGHSDSLDVSDADVILADGEDRTLIESRMKGAYYVLPFQIRDSYQAGQAYLKVETFKDDVPAGTAILTSGPVPPAAGAAK